MAANEIVNGIWRYPIKSMMGEEVQFADVTARGLAGDRAYAFVVLRALIRAGSKTAIWPIR